jgi:hypothetical protein
MTLPFLLFPYPVYGLVIRNDYFLANSSMALKMIGYT